MASPRLVERGGFPPLRLSPHLHSRLHSHLPSHKGMLLRPGASTPDVGPALTRRGEHERYGGYYTRKQVREIVAYAAERHITVVPEIELPAHTLSGVVAYPYLCCTGKQMTIPTKHFISRNLYCAGSERTWRFLRDVMSDVCELFPGKFVHIGGDEAKYDRWRKCPRCQAKMKELGLKSEKQLQGWMTREIESFLQARGKQILGWDEILSRGITNKAGIMTWHRPKTAVDGARRGHPVVMALTGHCYFDTPESKLPGEPPAATWLKPISLRMAYEWHPTPAGLQGEAAARILGAEGCVWSDQFIHGGGHLIKDLPGQTEKQSEKYIEYLTLPRAAALSEVTWTPRDRRDWDDFSRRMERMLVRYTKAGYDYRMPLPIVETGARADGSFVAKGRPLIEGGSVRYTTDGSTPTSASARLTGEVSVPESSPLKAVAFSPDLSRKSLVYERVDESAKYARHGLKLGEWRAGKVGARRPRAAVFDATGLINRNGTYVITFLYTGGGHRLDIHGVRVVRNGVDPVGEDNHKGFTGGRSQKNTYRIEVRNYETGASFKVEARICGDIGSDSNGLVFIRREK